MVFIRCVMAWIWSAAILFASPPPPLLINVDEAHPPFMHNEDGRAAGFYSTLIATAFSRMNVPVVLEPKPWARAVHDLDGGKAGIAGIYKTAERLKKYDYSEPLLVEKLVVYVQASRPVEFSKVEDLSGKTIGVMRGWSYGDAFDKAVSNGLIKSDPVSTDEQNFLKLSTGRIDAMIAIPESVAGFLVRFPSIHPARKPLLETPAYLAFAKSANQAALIERFNLVLKQMKEDGEYLRILTGEFARAPK